MTPTLNSTDISKFTFKKATLTVRLKSWPILLGCSQLPFALYSATRALVARRGWASTKVGKQTVTVLVIIRSFGVNAWNKINVNYTSHLTWCCIVNSMRVNLLLAFLTWRNWVNCTCSEKCELWSRIFILTPLLYGHRNLHYYSICYWVSGNYTYVPRHFLDNFHWKLQNTIYCAE